MMNTTLGIRQHITRTGVLLGFTLLSMTLVAGCGNLTAGGFEETTVLITGDESDAGQTASEPQPSSAPSPTEHEDDGSATLLGDLELTLQVFLRGPDGAWSELTTGERSLTLPISGGELEELLSERLGEGIYQEARVVFHAVEAEVTGGLEIGGVPIVDRIRVAIGDPVAVDRDIGLSVEEGQPAEVLIDLNSGEWLRTATETDGGLEVDVEVFEAAVSVISRSGP